MTYTAKTLSDSLRRELDNGYDVVRIAQVAFRIYQEYGRELTPDLDGIILQLMAMEEGPEFEFSENELRVLIEELASK